MKEYAQDMAELRAEDGSVAIIPLDSGEFEQDALVSFVTSEIQGRLRVMYLNGREFETQLRQAHSELTGQASLEGYPDFKLLVSFQKTGQAHLRFSYGDEDVGGTVVRFGLRLDQSYMPEFLGGLRAFNQSKAYRLS